MRYNTWFVVLVVAVVSLLAWIVARICFGLGFEWNCEQYLKRAADANTVAMAEKELSRAISYLEQNRLRNGNTGIYFMVPKNDLGFLYKNLTASLEELRLNLRTEGSSQLEQSNLLMKLRETILDESGGTIVTCPDGISVFPHNRLFAFWGTVSLVFGIIALIIVIKDA